MAGTGQPLLDSLLTLAGDYAGGGLRISVKTNLGPEFDIGSADLGGGGGAGGADGVSGPVGIRAAVLLRRADGSLVAQFGQAPATEPWRVALLAAAALGALVLVIRGLRR